mgnify:CR=1 FL=1
MYARDTARMEILHLLAVQSDITTVSDVAAAWATGVGAGIGALLVVLVRVLRSLRVSALLPSPWSGILATVLGGLASVGAVAAAGSGWSEVISAGITGIVVPLAGLLVRSDQEG